MSLKGKDELMEEFFAKGTIPEEHLIAALHEAIREDRIFPVLFVSGATNMATDHLLDFFKVYAPAPIERAPIAVKAPALEAVATWRWRCRDYRRIIPQSRRQRARRSDRVQDYDRPLRRPHHLL